MIVYEISTLLGKKVPSISWHTRSPKTGLELQTLLRPESAPFWELLDGVPNDAFPYAFLRRALERPDMFRDYEILTDKHSRGWDVVKIHTDVYAVSEKVRSVFAAAKVPSFTFCPCLVRGAMWYLAVPETVPVIDCLDLEKSDLEYFPDGRVSRFNSCVFLEGKIGDAPVFRIPQFRRTLYATPVIIDALRAAGVKGFSFFRTDDPKYPYYVGEAIRLE